MTGISAEEKARLRGRLVALTRDLMLVPSIPSRPDEIRRCCSIVRHHLESLNGIEVREFESEGHPSLLAAPAGCERPRILMCAHLDVVSHPDLSVYRSEIRDGRIYGPGSGDMKGALAILLEVFRAVQQRQPGAPLGLLVTSDEETGGEFGMGYLFREVGIRCDLALVPDGGSLTELTVEEKGILHLKVAATGRDGHAARPWLADNAIEKLMAVLAKVRRFFDSFRDSDTNWRPTCAPTMTFTGNETVNRIPAHAEAVLDIRFPAPHTVASILTGVTESVGNLAKLRVLIGAEASEFSPDPLFLETVKEIAGVDARLIRDDGGSDARFIAAHGIPVMMSRPLVGNLHAKDEWIDIESMVTFYRIYETYLGRRLSEPTAETFSK